MKIRPFKENDLGDIAVLYRQAFGEYAWTFKEIRNYLYSEYGLGFVLVTDLGDTVGGYLLCTEQPGRAVEIDCMAVAPAHKRKGYGKRFLNTVLDLGKTVRAFVAECDLKSQVFFRSCGFKAVRIKKHHWLGEELAYVFEKVPEPVCEVCGKRPSEHDGE